MAAGFHNKISKTKASIGRFSLVELGALGLMFVVFGLFAMFVVFAMVAVAAPSHEHQKSKATYAQRHNGNVTASNVSSPSRGGASDPKYGPVRVDSVQYKQCEGANLNFYAYGTNILLSVSNSDPACF